MADTPPAAACAPDPAEAPAARLAALRARGAAQADPVGLRFAEALARRSAGQDGEAARLLQARLDQALDALAQRLDAAPTAPAAAAPRAPRAAGPGPLGSLLQALAAHRGEPAAAPPPAPAARARGAQAAPQPAPAARAELQALPYFRDTWTQLKVSRQLNQSLAQPPQNAGPLNSHRLVLRALERLQALSPAYLEHFVAQLDTLFWLERANPLVAAPAAGSPAEATAGKPERKRRPPRPKAAS